MVTTNFTKKEVVCVFSIFKYGTFGNGFDKDDFDLDRFS